MATEVPASGEAAVNTQTAMPPLTPAEIRAQRHATGQASAKLFGEMIDFLLVRGRGANERPHERTIQLTVTPRRGRAPIEFYAEYHLGEDSTPAGLIITTVNGVKTITTKSQGVNSSSEMADPRNLAQARRRLQRAQQAKGAAA